MIYWPAKAPGEVEDFAFDFTPALAAGEVISSRIVTATGVTKNSDAISGSQVQVWLQDGTLGTPGVVVCTITTSLGRTYSETAILPIGEEPVSLDMAKRQCRLDGVTTEDEYLLELIQAAREYVERYCGSAFIAAPALMTFRSFDDLAALTAAPVQTITSVTYLDASGVEQTLGTSVYEMVNVAADPLRPAIRLAFNQQWPAIRPADDAVRVNAVVGYTVVPSPVIRAMLLLIGQWFDYRYDFIQERGTFAQLPNAVAALLANYRR